MDIASPLASPRKPGARKLQILQTLAAMLEAFQESPIEAVNQGIGSNVITSECPLYLKSVRPSALDRLDDVLRIGSGLVRELECEASPRVLACA